ncbi:MAG: hypothetical protein KDB02_00985 [Acidimicrobiales bacterium]|nr:hypothetical protein [Acidimicrobiales bacterium]
MVDTTVEVPTRTLVFGMSRPDGTISAADVYDVAQACGQTSEQVRSCLRRLVAEGLLAREGSGRTASYRLTEDAQRRRGGVIRRHRLAYEQDRRGRGWDGNWHLAAFAVPEEQRSARDRLRDGLIEAGGAAINNGLYVCAHPWENEVRAVASTLGVLDRLSLASTMDLEVGGVGSSRELARSLWPVDDLAHRYERFVDEHGTVLDALQRLQARHDRISDADYLPGSLRMVVAFQSIFRADPLLPPELLPRPWPGRAARDVMLRSRRLALQLREEHERPALFSSFDDLVGQSA